MVLLSVSFLEVAKYIGYILVALICLMVMIMVHEFGHYTFGKIFHFKINEFSIGFGPKLFSHTNAHTGEVFAVRCIPFGGFCQFAGEDEDALVEGDFNSKPWWQRIIVLLGGVFFNYIFAILFLSIFFMSYGEVNREVGKVHQYQDTAIVQQFEPGDIIIEIDGKKAYASFNQKFVKMMNKDELDIVVDRNGEEITLNVKKGIIENIVIDENGVSEDKSYYGYGIQLTNDIHLTKLPFFEAIGHSFVFGWESIEYSMAAIGSIFTGGAKVSETVGGTMTAISLLAMLVNSGMYAIIYGLGIFSISLAFMNVLPIPALDGSRVIFCLIEGIRGKPVNRKIEGIIHFVGLILLFILTIVLDIIHFVG